MRRETDSLVPVDKIHPPLSITIETCFERIREEKINSAGIWEWNFRIANFSELYRRIGSIVWEPLYNILDPDTAIHFFYSLLKDCMDDCVPRKLLRTGPPRYTYPSWYSIETRRNIKKKAYHHRRYKKTTMWATVRFFHATGRLSNWALRLIFITTNYVWNVI